MIKLTRKTKESRIEDENERKKKDEDKVRTLIHNQKQIKRQV